MAIVLALVFTLAPAYIYKVSLANLPTNLLMLLVILAWLVFFGWLVNNKFFGGFFRSILEVDKKLLVFVGLFLLAGTLSLFAHGFDRQKLGAWIVLFLQPVSLYFIVRFVASRRPELKELITVASYTLLAAAGLYAVVQYFTLYGLPPAWWGNSVEPKRAIAFFVHPNFYALWAAPLLAFLIPDLALNLKSKILNLKSVAWILGAIGLFFSFSRAGWLGLAAAVAVYLITAADKKMRKMALYAIILIAVIVVAVPNFRYRLLLPFYGEKSAVSRLSLWQTGIKAIKESPVTGLGLTGFSRQWATLNTDTGLPDTHNFPHNIFLDFWVETGLLGLISFLGIAWLVMHRGFKSRSDSIKFGVALFLITILVQGQIDNPYFKNDLALVFWMILALA